MIYFGYNIYRRVYYNDVPQGFTATILAIILFSGVQLISLGLIGEYVLRIYNQVRNRPLFVIDKIIQDGKTVFKYAVTNMADCSELIMKRNNLTNEDVNWLVPHQANKRIIDAIANRMKLDDSKVLMNIEKYGNTTSATIGLVLNDFERLFKKGDNIILAAFGGGFTWGSIYLKWAYDKK